MEPFSSPAAQDVGLWLFELTRPLSLPAVAVNVSACGPVCLAWVSA